MGAHVAERTRTDRCAVMVDTFVISKKSIHHVPDESVTLL